MDQYKPPRKFDDSDHIIIPTPAIYETSDIVDQWFSARAPGGLVVGKSRLGKTTMIEYLRGERKGLLPTAGMTCLHSKGITENEFYEHFLESTEHLEFEKGTTRQKRRRLISWLKTLAGEDRSIMIFLDDAHELQEKEFEWLSDIYNSLAKENVYSCFILVGEPGLYGLREGFKRTHQIQIIARFMKLDFEFFSIRNINDIKTCLEGFDLQIAEEKGEVERGKSEVLTERYFPEAFSAGWRLTEETENVYRAFEEVHAKSRKSWPFVIPMSDLFQSIHFMLRTYSCKNSSFTGFTLEQWIDAVKRSGYKQAGNYMSPPEKIPSYD